MSRVIYVEGRVFWSFREVCKHYNISYNEAYYRLRSGLSMEEVIHNTSKGNCRK